jgi:hypothetical protein
MLIYLVPYCVGVHSNADRSGTGLEYTVMLITLVLCLSIQ